MLWLNWISASQNTGLPESACLSLKSVSAEINIFGRAWKTRRAKHKKVLMRRVHPAWAGTVDMAFLGLEWKTGKSCSQKEGGCEQIQAKIVSK